MANQPKDTRNRMGTIGKRDQPVIHAVERAIYLKNALPRRRTRKAKEKRLRRKPN